MARCTSTTFTQRTCPKVIGWNDSDLHIATWANGIVKYDMHMQVP